MTQEQALKILKTGANVFLTGEPGSGKSHTVNEYVKYLRAHDIEPSITASTGIAATHIGGMTIHSWSGIGIKNTLSDYDLDKIASTEYISKRIRFAKVLIIDEISMLSPNILDMVDAVLREIKQKQEPFGGMQIIFVGDFFQLPPIKKIDENNKDQDLFESKNYFFAYESSAWDRARPVVCYLDEQYRQDDSDFLSVLSAIRGGFFDEMHFEHIAKRKYEGRALPDITKLFSHNINVDQMNFKMLEELPGKTEIFEMISSGKDALVESLKKGCLSPEKLILKEGAVVMFTKNSQKDGFVNGTLGTVVGFNSFSKYPIVKLKNGKNIELDIFEWTIEDSGRVLARIKQIPLRLAWAMTVHKSQGMSLDSAIMDLSGVFEYGQGYVALSRVRRLSGLYILGWNEKAFRVHPDVSMKDVSFREMSDEAISAFSNLEEMEIKKMHENFITACGGNIIASFDKKQKKEKENTIDVTLSFWKMGKNISEIAEVRGLKENTILDHVEKLSALGKIEKPEFSRLFNTVIQNGVDEIRGAFLKYGIEKVSPAFEHLKGKYSYDDLRLARLILDLTKD